MPGATRHHARAYIPELDGLRALAVTLVVLHHISVPYITGGFIGVAVFFVLSGFLITSLLLDDVRRTGAVDVRAFFRRRAARLYPALVVAVGLAVLVALLDGRAVSETLTGAPLALGYVTNIAGWLGWSSAGLLNHTWSLAVEAQFYLLWPLVIMALAGGRRPAVWCLLAAAVCMGLSLLNTRAPLAGGTYYLPAFFAVPLLLGASVAALGVHARGRSSGVLAAAAWAGLAAILAVSVMSDSPHTTTMLDVGYPVVFVASTALVAGLVAGRIPLLSRIFAWRLPVWIGQRSYGIYLYHYAFTLALLDHPTAVRLPLILVLTLATAEVSWHFVERPFLRRGRGVRGHVEVDAATVAPVAARA